MARLLPLLLYFFFMLKIIANVVIASSNVLHPNCTDKCGNLSNIPYPFGIGDGCFREGFEITCEEKEGVHYPVLRGKNSSLMNVTSIFLAEGQARINMSVGYECYNKTGLKDQQLPVLDLSDTPFEVSPVNTFVALGCNTVAYITEISNSTDLHDYGTDFGNMGEVGGCMSMCKSLDSVNANGTCKGSGCCQNSIPKNLVHFNMSLDGNFTNSNILEFNPCSYALVVETDWFNFSSLYLKGESFKNQYRDGVPLMLDWVAGSENCSEAARNTTSYACQSNNNRCVNPTNGDGYRCDCLDGYEGNPYLLDGCQDIEWLNQNPKSIKCHPDPDRSIRLPLWVKVTLGQGCGLVSLTILSILMWTKCQKRKLSKEKKRFFQQNGGLILYEQIQSVGSNAFKIFRKEELEKATNMFDKNLILGHGGHGTIYRGRLEGDISVAIKKSRVIDESQKKEFVKEILILSQINHRNVVKILGCCLEVEVPMLVYEFVHNGTLFDYIHGKYPKQPIPFDTRLRIAAESAEALAYLHSSASPPILHGDVKSSNILLDENYVAKVSDFGASTLVAMDEIQIATVVQGTCGYLDPEYIQTYIFTEKSDVYSFGVVLLELVTRKKAFYVDRSKEEKSLASIFISLMKENRLMECLDDQLTNEGYIEFLQELLKLVRQCLSIKGEERPTMKEVAEGIQALRKLAHRPWEQYPSEELQSLLGKSPTYDVVANTTRFYSLETRSVLNIDQSKVLT